uniref:Uncharacterized protein n=1 Tax=Acrobeloides nanus TaxID=290746 RepID=A0A914CQB7_9BILA
MKRFKCYEEYIIIDPRGNIINQPVETGKNDFSTQLKSISTPKLDSTFKYKTASTPTFDADAVFSKLNISKLNIKANVIQRQGPVYQNIDNYGRDNKNINISTHYNNYDNVDNNDDNDVIYHHNHYNYANNDNNIHNGDPADTEENNHAYT